MKIGDYVRTEYGIFKIRDDRPFKDEKNKLNYLVNGRYTCVLKEDIKISSSNIIDLIEVGDYVNGIEITHIKDGKPYVEDFNDSYYSFIMDEEDIRSIVTKEQFENMEYKIGD